MTDITTATTGADLTVANPAGFASGDQVLLISLHPCVDQNNFLFALVSNVSGSVININKDVASPEPPAFFQDDGSGGFDHDNIQLIKVPQYQDLTITSSGELSCHEFDGNTGGILCFKVAGTLTINEGGQIIANEKINYLNDGGDGGDGANRDFNFGEPGEGVTVAGKSGDDASIANTPGFHWRQGYYGHVISVEYYSGSNCETFNDATEASGDAGSGSAFPGELGGRGKNYCLREYDLTNYLWTPGKPGRGGSGGSGGIGTGAGGDGGSGSNGNGTISDGTQGTNPTGVSTDGGDGGNGGKGGGAIMIKARTINFNGTTWITNAFEAKGGDGADGTNGEGNGGNGGDGSDGSDGVYECSSQYGTRDLIPQGSGAAPGRAGDGADAGSGGNGGDGGSLYLLYESSVGGLNLPSGKSLGDLSDLSGGSGGTGASGVGTKGTSGSFGADGSLNKDLILCCDPPGGSSGSGGESFTYEWVEKTVDICDCESTFENLTKADGALLSGYNYTNSLYVEPDEVSDGEVFWKSNYDDATTKLYSYTKVVTRDHDPDNASGIRLTRRYYCQL